MRANFRCVIELLWEHVHQYFEIYLSVKINPFKWLTFDVQTIADIEPITQNCQNYMYIENMFILPKLNISIEYHRLFGISNM
jgi:hypothetical protein